jgi:hypothetical protein
VLWGNSDNTSCQAPEVYDGIFWYTHWYELKSCVRVLIARPYREYQNCGQPDQ